MKYTINIKVKDITDQYGDQYTLEAYFKDQLEVIARTLELSVTSLDVKVARK